MVYWNSVNVVTNASPTTIIQINLIAILCDTDYSLGL